VRTATPAPATATVTFARRAPRETPLQTSAFRSRIGRVQRFPNSRRYTRRATDFPPLQGPP
jgi:hypothetical protein